MSQTLILIETHYTTRFSNTQNSEEQVIDNDTPSFAAYCDQLPKLLEQFNRATNFQEEIKKIKPQLGKNNFAQITFKEALIQYHITLVPPKFN